MTIANPSPVRPDPLSKIVFADPDNPTPDEFKKAIQEGRQKFRDAGSTDDVEMAEAMRVNASTIKIWAEEGIHRRIPQDPAIRKAHLDSLKRALDGLSKPKKAPGHSLD